jgi:hypothetical protein
MLVVPLLVLVIASNVIAGPIIGTFDSSRSGIANVVDGTLTDDLRTSLNLNFPSHSIVGTDTITPAFLDTIDILLIHTGSSIDDPLTSLLSASEQSAVSGFVISGGNAFIAVDGYFFPESMSFLDPFQMQIADDFLNTNSDIGQVTDPPAHSVTNGPFGQVTIFTTFVPGWFTDLGPYASALATLDGNGQPSIAVIEANAIAPGSGRIVFFSDPAFGDEDAGLLFGANEVLFLNSIYWLSPNPIPEPTTFSLAALGSLSLLGVARWRRKARL